MKSVEYAGYGVAAALLVGFGILADEVSEGSTLAFDNAVLLSLREPNDPANPLGPAWLEEAARDVTALGSVAVLGFIVLVSVVFLVLSRKRATAALLAVSVGSGAIVSTILKVLFDRPRPDIPGVARVFSASFPSGHAALSAIVYLVLGVILADLSNDRRIKTFLPAVALFLTALIGVTRVYLGVHFPSDVVAGWSLGGAWSLLSLLALRYLHERHGYPTPNPPMRR